MKIKRFRVFDTFNQKRVFECHTTKEVFDYLIRPGLNSEDLFIDDVVDDIEVTAYDFMAAWEAGERPQDLQMF